ncbi:YkuS family protein [Clostridium manihotivorum]|uniref:YkuS family protein n=1 Tax=Clostridium manihotivorum TaxID=2320868 RepID=A0A3R5X3J7_9CLOT|nr:YkuS family protein [Clostridium manihotivorum]QAA33622.1 hypothetical protein C1I91_19365 [Clostridium manihotivorum]
MKKIGVERGAAMIAGYLMSKGFSVEILSDDLESSAADLDRFDAILTAGHNTDLMGISDTSTKVPIINISGLTQDEIRNTIKQRTYTS